MTALTKLARDQQCFIRVPHVCNGRTDTTVWCHVRMTGVSGYGLKAPDLLGAFGCQACHDYVDGRAQGTHTYEERRTMLIEGMVRTLYYLLQKGILKLSINRAAAPS